MTTLSEIGMDHEPLKMATFKDQGGVGEEEEKLPKEELEQLESGKPYKPLAPEYHGSWMEMAKEPYYLPWEVDESEEWEDDDGWKLMGGGAHYQEEATWKTGLE